MKQTIIHFIQDLLKNVNIPVNFLAPPYTSSPQLDKGLRDSLPETAYQSPFFSKWISGLETGTIYHLTDTFHCSYSLLRLPESHSFMICGPVLLEEITHETFLEIARNMNIREETHAILKNYYLHLPCFPAIFLYQNIFTTLGDYIWGKEKYNIQYIDFNVMDKWYESHKIHQAAFDASKIDKVNLPMIEIRYSLENQILDAIVKGNEQKALETASKLCTCFTPQGLIYDLRDYKNFTLALNTLMRKKVEEAGVHPMHIDLSSGQNVAQIEQITQKEQCYHVMMQMIHTYCQLVNTYRRTDYSLLTQKIITYVTTDLSGDLSLKAMSERLSVNASYLSTLFKKEMGIPLTDYVNRQRMEQAKKLLIVTVLPVKTIAQECGISDVYYFNRLFKKVTGYTPKAYREGATREHEPLDAPPEAAFIQTK